MLSNLENKSTQKAQFKTVVALHLNGQLNTFTGICKGEITTEKQGKKGFGYDPIFKAEGYDKTFAEISLEEKNTIYHCVKAVKSLIAFLNNSYIKLQSAYCGKLSSRFICLKRSSCRISSS